MKNRLYMVWFTNGLLYEDGEDRGYLVAAPDHAKAREMAEAHAKKELTWWPNVLYHNYSNVPWPDRNKAKVLL